MYAHMHPSLAVSAPSTFWSFLNPIIIKVWTVFYQGLNEGVLAFTFQTSILISYWEFRNAETGEMLAPIAISLLI
jgi:hypothetical protein